jgi:MFS superfamily sulfate permease-like transporter
VGGILVGSFSGAPLLVSGPAAGLAVIVYELVQKFGIAGLCAVTVAAGAIQLVAGILRLGQLFRALAPAVIYGMLAGIGILIFGAQFHVMVDDTPRENGIQNLLSIPAAVHKGIFPVDGSSHHIAAVLGLATIIILVGWTKFAPKSLKWMPGALVGVVIATVTSQVGAFPVRYVELPDNLIGSLQLPPLASFSTLLSVEMVIAAVSVAFIASAETLLSATAVDQMHDGPRANYDRELVAQGTGNMLSGLLGGIPMTGVIVRSATNVTAGAKTRRSTMFHGLWILLLVAAAPTVLRMVPTASLAAVLVYTGYKLVNPNNVRRLLRYGGAPVAIYAVTVVTIVATDLLTGILIGLGCSVVKVLYALSRMDIQVKEAAQQTVDLHITGAATFFRMPKLVDTLEGIPQNFEVRVHFDKLVYMDHACMDALSTWEQKRKATAGKVVVEWDELMQKYGQRRRVKQLDEVAGVASH